jgi:hypothetical protein
LQGHNIPQRLFHRRELEKPLIVLPARVFNKTQAEMPIRGEKAVVGSFGFWLIDVLLYAPA